MTTIEEKACEHCGNPIMEVATKPLATDKVPKLINVCDACGHTTPPDCVIRFQWPSRLKSIVEKLCTPDELKRLRCDPINFINETLNARLKSAGSPQIEVDKATAPITLQVKTDCE
jgi:hypothetical protein